VGQASGGPLMSNVRPHMKIPALRVEINGELIAVAGADDLSLLSGTVGLGTGKGQSLDASEVMLSVMGLKVNCPQPRQLTWGNGVKLKRGDRVTFEIVEVEHPSPPDKVLDSPSPTQLAAEIRNVSKKRASRPQ
jgi:hypothetical protein